MSYKSPIATAAALAISAVLSILIALGMSASLDIDETHYLNCLPLRRGRSLAPSPEIPTSSAIRGKARSRGLLMEASECETVNDQASTIIN